MEDVWGEVEGATPTGGGNYFEYGDYIVLIEKLSLKKGYKGTCFVGELFIEKSVQTDPEVKPSPAGQTRSFVENFKTQPEMAKKNVKAFFIGALGCLGYEEHEVTGDNMKKGTGADQPLRGVRMRMSTYWHTTQKGKVIARPRWIAVPNSAEDLKTNRHRLDTLAASAADAEQEKPAAAPATSAEPKKLLGSGA